MLKLDRVGVAGELQLDTPSGSRILVSGDAANTLTVAVPTYVAMRELLGLSRAIIPGRSTFGWLRLTNPTGQDIAITIDRDNLINWPAGKKMRVASYTRALRLLLKV